MAAWQSGRRAGRSLLEFMTDSGAIWARPAMTPRPHTHSQAQATGQPCPTGSPHEQSGATPRTRERLTISMIGRCVPAPASDYFHAWR
ncbi:hypothetical protein K437DRAFT_60374 [Tilletiaria anomala UBC 951]|uniref:Uncharacterized protein n=1 Tax=Tilletiaria anomala (strain ATCC 24038 / CBS 436.72 / UBC 951) TaxID=1037660 RepID=A0A066WA80_TILAU|nr:uncharacterized protein K437DRAFT_60374 [Tilletiaria anomala UBC 951]KDN50832.1 hypothetical protein K437DRAFT_60374 [Tilletiaria anomala UBC 951]